MSNSEADFVPRDLYTALRRYISLACVALGRRDWVGGRGRRGVAEEESI
jgi:hypothetical protein